MNSPRASERGSALLLAVLILLGLTALGLISLQQTGTDLVSAGSVARASQARTAAEAGATHGIVRFRQGIQAYLTKIQKDNTEAGTVNRNVLVAELSSAIPSPEDTGKNQLIPPVNPPTGVSSAAKRPQQIAYEVEATWVQQVAEMPGYSMDTDACFQVFDFNARGGIPSADQQTVTDTLSSSATVLVRIRSRALLGVARCLF